MSLIPCGSSASPNDVLPGVRVQQRHVRVAPAAGEAGPRLAHERRKVSVLLRDLLDAVLERERVVRAGKTAARCEVDLPLRPRVLAVRRDDVDPDLGHLFEDPADRRHVVVPQGVEDVVPGVERLVRVAGQEVELELRPDQRLEPHRQRLLQRPAEHVPGRRGERRPVVPLRVADEACRRVDPRDDGRASRDPGTGAGRRTRVPRGTGCRRPRPSACPARLSPRTCSVRAPHSRPRGRSGSSSIGRCRACRAARTGRTRSPASASPRGSPARRSSIGSPPAPISASAAAAARNWVYTAAAASRNRWRRRAGPRAGTRTLRGRILPALGVGVIEGGRLAQASDREPANARAPARVRSSLAGRRSRRGRLGRGCRRPPVPGRDERRLDGRDPRARPARHPRRRPRAGGHPRVRPQRTTHQPGPGATRSRARRRGARGVHAARASRPAGPTPTRWRSSSRAATTSSAASPSAGR